MSGLRHRLLACLPALRRYARALVLERELADDLVQETLLRALARESTWQRERDLRAWLFTILHNLFVSDWRRRCRSPVVSGESWPEPAAPGEADADCRLRDLELALEALPVTQREVLLLVSVEGLSYDEAARVLGVPRGTVMSRLHRARRRLADCLAGEEAPAGPKLEVVRHE